MNKKSLVLNSLIVIFEIISFIILYSSTHNISIEYYTVDNNILALISSSLFLIFQLKKIKIPTWLKLFKYVATIGMMVTFLVVLFILGPMLNFNYGYLLFNKVLIFQHLLCPILCIITFIAYDNIDTLSIKDNFYGLIFTIIYAIVLIILNIIGIVNGPYPFLKVREQSAFMSIVWFIIILSLAYFIAFLLRKFSNKK